MTEYTNSNPPSANENTEKTLKRLEKTNKKIEAVSDTLKKVGFAIPVLTGLVGMFAGGVTAGGFAAMCGAFVAIPVTTAAIALPVAAKTILQQKIDSLKKKVSKPLSSFLDKQAQATKASESYYQRVSKNEESTIADIKDAKKEFEDQTKKEHLYNSAASLAKKDGKEKTIGRLMGIVERAEKVDSSSCGLLTALQGGMTAMSLSLSPHLILPYSKVLGAVAAVSAVATVYCAAKTVDNHKRKEKAQRAYGLLKTYTQEQ